MPELKKPKAHPRQGVATGKWWGKQKKSMIFPHCVLENHEFSQLIEHPCWAEYSCPWSASLKLWRVQSVVSKFKSIPLFLGKPERYLLRIFCWKKSSTTSQLQVKIAHVETSIWQWQQNTNTYEYSQYIGFLSKCLTFLQQTLWSSIKIAQFFCHALALECSLRPEKCTLNLNVAGVI